MTFSRDKEFKRFCRNNQITWVENINSGVLRGLLNREDWFEKWEDYMYQPQLKFQPNFDNFIATKELETLEPYFLINQLACSDSKNFQQGGRRMALKYAGTFFESRFENYMNDISKPEASRRSCSRLSP